MSYIGSTPTTQAFSPAVDIFSGNGSATVLSLSKPVLSAAQVQVVVNNVPQNPASAFTVGSQTITFTSAPSAGTNNIYVYYVSPITQLIAPSQGTVLPASLTTGGPYWDSSGNLGVGGITPSSMGGGLQSGASSVLETVVSSQTLVGGNAYYTGAAWKAIRTQTGYAAMRLNAVGPGVTSFHQNLASYTAGDTLTAMDTTDVRMVIDASGNVGIGTSSPSQKLQVNGNARLGTGAYLGFPDGGGAFSRFANGEFVATSGQQLQLCADNSDGTIAFFTTSTGSASNERMRIDSSGNLLVGATSGFAGVKCYVAGVAGASNPNGILNVASTTTGDTSYPIAQFSKFDATTNTSAVLIRFAISNNTVGQGQINANGASAAAFGSFSDRRLKENITDLPSQLANIMALRPVEFDYIESEGGGHQIGFIAQEVKEIYPDLVGEREDGMYTLSDMNKNDARLIKAVQEMKAIIDAQASTITALTARITSLENK